MYQNAHMTSRGFVLRTVDGVFGACALIASSTGTRMRGWSRPSMLQTVGAFMMMCLPVFALLAVAVLVMAVAPHLVISKLAFAFAGEAAVTKKSGTPDKKPAKIREMESNLKALAKELELGQTEMTAGPISTERGEELEAKAQEMEELQSHLDRYNKIAGIVSASKQVERVTLPDETGGSRKMVHTTPGHLFVASEAFRQYRAQGKQGWSAWADMKSKFGKTVRLLGDDARSFEAKAFDPATLSDLGTDAVIEIDRDRELVRFAEPEYLTIRDMLNEVSTTSDAIRYVKHTATTRPAVGTQVQATRGGLKPWLHLTFVPTTVSVETIAVLAKVTEQDVDDAPRLVGYINGEMTLDVKVAEEQQLLWGTGADGQILGLFMDVDIPEFNRAGGGDTVIDTIRKMRTDLRKKRVVPTFVALDPIDWEEVELTKGTTAQYIWGLVTDLRGPRIWSLRVVESDAMTHIDNGERRILVGDGVRGATIYDRHDVRLAIGYVDDDFARNLRTLRAEERLALAVKRPFAFEYAITQAAGS
jgi:HK97 family phage major capsid protein